MDDVVRLLRDFLELMSIANEWNMPKLKEKLEWNIIHKFDMIQRLPHANQMSAYHDFFFFFGFIVVFNLASLVLEEAEKYNAVRLNEALAEFGKHNGMILNILQRN